MTRNSCLLVLHLTATQSVAGDSPITRGNLDFSTSFPSHGGVLANLPQPLPGKLPALVTLLNTGLTGVHGDHGN